MKRAIFGAAIIVLARLAWPTPPVVTEEAVAWTEVWGASPKGGILVKTGPVGWTAGGVSTRSIASGDGFLEFGVDGAASLACGLTRHGHQPGYEEIDFAIRLDSKGRVGVVESGAVKASGRSYAPGDRFRVGIEQGLVTYRHNGDLFFTSSVPVSYPLRAQSSLYGPGASIRRAVLRGALVENVEWMGSEGTRSYANDVVKARGRSGSEASALSAQAIASQEARIEWRVPDPTGDVALGLVPGLDGTDSEALLCGLRVRDGAVWAVAAGQPVRRIAPAAAGDRLAIVLQEEAVEYRQNGRLLGTSAFAAARPLRIEVVLSTLGSAIDGVVVSGGLVRLAARMPVVNIPSGHYEDPPAVSVASADPAATVTYTTDGFEPTHVDEAAPTEGLRFEDDAILKARAWATDLAPSAVRVAEYTVGPTNREEAVWGGLVNTEADAVGGLTKTGGAEAWDAHAVSTRGIASLDGYVETIVADTAGGSMIGLSEPGQSAEAPIGFALELSGGRVYVDEAGRRLADVGVSVTGDRLRVSLRGGLVQYRRSGRLVYTSHVQPALPLVARARFHTPNAAFEQTVLAGRLQDERVSEKQSVRDAPGKRSLLPELPAPALSPAPGTYISQVTVSISALPGATIHYTTDGTTEPSEGSPTYVAPLQLAATATLKAKAFFPSEWDPSPTTTGTYSVQVAAPVLSPAGGTFSGVKSVRVTSATSGAVVHYTLNGGEPTETDPAIGSTGTVLLAASGTLKAKAFKPGLAASDVTTAGFTFERLGDAAGGSLHSLVARPDGTVFAWGYNSHGELGDDTTTLRKYPVQVLRVSDVIAVAAGTNHSLALTSDGHVWAWGYNIYGQLGNGTTTASALQRYEVLDTSGIALADVVAIAAGANHSLALKSDGSVWAWGSNQYGQLGDDTTTPHTRATVVPGIEGAAAISAGSLHSLAASGIGGGAWAWGSNGVGQLGDGTTTERHLPAVVEGLTGTWALQGGIQHSTALGIDGLVWTWGANGYGQLGDGTQRDRLTAVRVVDLGSASAIASGSFHVLALVDGDVWTWGAGGSGQLGDGTTDLAREQPTKLPEPSSVMRLGAGAHHSLAIDSGGAVWAWGSNGSGQLGDGTTLARTSPVRISDPGFSWRVATPVLSVAAGTYSSAQTVTITCATSGASIYYSMDGGEPTTPYAGPVSIDMTTLLRARATRAGQPDSDVASALYTLKPATPTFSPGGGTYSSDPTVTISCAPTSCASLGQTLRYTTDGGEPSGSSPEYTSPLLINQTTTLKTKAFKTGWADSDTRSATYTLARGTLAAPTLQPAEDTFLDSVVVSMSSISGATIRYTLDGTEPTTSSPEYSSPVTLSVTTTVKAKAYHPEWTASATAAATYTIKVGEPPTISLASGEYPLGQAVTLTSPLGTSIRYTLDGSSPTASSLSLDSGATLAVMKALTLKAVSHRPGCELSDAAVEDYTVTGAVAATTVSGGSNHSLLAQPNGAVWAWGYNQSGKLGDGTTVQRTLPVQLASPTGIVTLDAGANHSMAVGSGGEIWAWGLNNYGQLGDGTVSSRLTPVELGFASDVVAVSAGDEHTLAVRVGGTVWAWGRNAPYGQLGVGSTTPSSSTTPLQASSLADVVSVGAGAAHSLAAKSDGTAWAWGLNNYGQLGDGTTTQRNSPVQVSGLSGVQSVAAGASHSLAAKSDGTVWAWGYNGHGELGDGTQSTRKEPVQVVGLTGVVAVAAGANHTLAVLRDGTLWAWGQNGYGQLGDGTTTVRLTAIRVPIPAPVVAAGAGGNHSLAVALDGTVWAWGQNTYGQLGLGTTASPRLTPTRVSAGDYEWRVAVPTFSPLPAGYSTEKTVTLSSLTSGATICYTTDGTDPSGCQTSVPSGGSVSVAQSLTLRAIATKAGMFSSEGAQGTYTLTVSAPTLSPLQGTHYTDVNLTMTAPAGASIRYTTDGSDPTETTGTVYTAPVPVTSTQTIYARAFRPGWTASGRAGSVYTMRVADPTTNPNGGSFGAAQTVALATTTPGAAIHHTTDGREPTLADPAGTSVDVGRSTTVRAKAFRDGWTTSGTVAAAFSLTLGSAAAPTMDPSAGSYDVPQLVVLSSETPDARIRYTTDGTEPTLFSPAYRVPLRIDETVTLKAKAFAGDMAPSSTTVAAYVIAAAQVAAPRFTPATGPFTTARTVTVTCVTTGAVIHYTTDGADPTPSDPTVVSGGTIDVDRSMTVKATAWLDGVPSATREGHYQVTGAVAAGTGHSLALHTDGHVWSWGANTSGQLGDGTTTARQRPGEVQASAGVPLTGAVAVEAGYFHSLAVVTDGHVWAWGKNGYGQLGNGTSTSSPVVYPVEVKRQSPSGPALDGVVALAAGQSHTVALRSDGTVWAWGQNTYAALGDGTTTNRPYAVSVLRALDGQPLDGVVAIAAAAAYGHSLALRSDGTVWGWGRGVAVDGSTNAYTRAIQISGVSDLVGIAAGEQFSAAVRVDGTVWAWGYNGHGQLGHGSTVTGVRPERALNLTRAAQLDVGATGDHVVALVPGGAGDQAIWAWGSGSSGSLGDSSTGAYFDRLSPAQVSGMVDVVATAGGGSHTLAILDDATVRTFGEWSALGRDVDFPYLPSVPSPAVDPVVAGQSFVLGDASWVVADPDGDGLSTGFEWRLGTDPLKADTNGDGVPDGAAVHDGKDPSNPDTDGDGVRNADEVAQGTDPLRADTDNDGTGDAEDCYPLDPTRQQCLPPDPGDQTPPLINLSEPTNAILVSSLP